MQNNPFFYGGEVFGKDFCGRAEELNELLADVHAGMKCLIYAPRRIGKTSLLCELQTKLDDQNIKNMKIDILGTLSKEEFIQQYFKGFMASIAGSFEKSIKLLKDTLKFKPEFSVNVSETGSTSLGVSVSRQNIDMVLEEVLNLPFKYAQKHNTVVCIMIDEFQRVKELKLEAKLRSIFQTHSRHVSYMFSGSKTTMLNEMFTDPESSFYQSVKKMTIGPIPVNDWREFIHNRFEKTGKLIPATTIDQINEIAGGFPFYVQQLCYIIWNMTNIKVTSQILEKAVETTLLRNTDTFYSSWEPLPLPQKKVLRMVSEDLEIYNQNSLLDNEITTPSVQSAVKALTKKEIFTINTGKPEFQDPFFKYWVVRNFE